MNIFETFDKKYPLADGRNVVARVGLRFLYCTFPYFAFVLTAAALGYDKIIALPAHACVLVIPILGGLIDWYRLYRLKINFDRENLQKQKIAMIRDAHSKADRI